jgi:hypothetical protein
LPAAAWSAAEHSSAASDARRPSSCAAAWLSPCPPVRTGLHHNTCTDDGPRPLRAPQQDAARLGITLHFDAARGGAPRAGLSLDLSP